MIKLQQKEFRVLIVDDNQSIYEDFSAILTPQNRDSVELSRLSQSLFGDETDSSAPVSDDIKRVYSLDYAANEKEASAMVKSSVEDRNPYALCFMDSRMTPGLDGVQATRKIWEFDPNIEVVLCTAYTDYTWQEITGIIGISDQFLILKKPFDISAVTQLASTLTHKWEGKNEFRTYLDKLENKADHLFQAAGSMLAEKETSNLLKQISSSKVEKNPNSDTSIEDHSNLLYEIAELKSLEFEKIRNEFNQSNIMMCGVLKLINNLGYFSKFNREVDQNSGKYTNVKELVESVTESYLPSFEDEGIKLSIANQESQIDNAFVDPSKLTIVLRNLINNAIYAVKNSQQKDINISLSQQKGQLQILVKDSGVGIPKDIQADIMKPFFTTKTLSNGTGLGLTISQNIVEHFKGSLNLKSSSDEGTSFEVTLPLS